MVEPNRVPSKLTRDAILEAVFEVRFSSNRNDLSSILPGLLYGELSELFPSAEQLPLSNMPPEMLNLNPALAYQPTHALKGKNITLRFGQKSAVLSVARPYMGWQEFKKLILKCVHALGKTSFVQTVERCSLKYTNLLSEGRNAQDLRQLDISVRLGQFDIANSNTLIRSEFIYRGLTNIVQIVSGATLTLIGSTDPKPYQGVVLDIDTIKNGPLNNFQTELSDVLDEIHNTEKAVFFGLLTDETFNKLGPIAG